jgi:hypothetical protein
MAARGRSISADDHVRELNVIASEANALFEPAVTSYNETADSTVADDVLFPQRRNRDPKKGGCFSRCPQTTHFACRCSRADGRDFDPPTRCGRRSVVCHTWGEELRRVAGDARLRRYSVDSFGSEPGCARSPGLRRHSEDLGCDTPRRGSSTSRVHHAQPLYV